MRIDPLGVAHQPVCPLHRQEIGLLEEIEELVARPLGVGKALVPGLGLDDGLHLLAGHALDRVRPQVEISFAQARLQFERALRIAQPIIRHLADRFHHIGDLGILIVVAAFFARFEVGGQGLAALFDHAGDVAGKLLHVGGAAFDWFGRGSHGNASIRVPAQAGFGLSRPQMDFTHNRRKTHHGPSLGASTRARPSVAREAARLNLALVILREYSLLPIA